MTTATLSIRLDPEIKEQLGRLAERTRRSRSHLASEAIAAYVARELETIRKIEEGVADWQAGRVVPHEEVMGRVEACIVAAKKRA